MSQPTDADRIDQINRALHILDRVSIAAVATTAAYILGHLAAAL